MYFMDTRAKEVLLSRDSSGNRVSSAGITVRTRRKWQAHEAVDQAEARPRHSILVGPVAIGQAWIGSIAGPRYDKAKGERDTS